MKNYQKIIVLLLCVVSVCFSVIFTASAAEEAVTDNLTFAVEASASAVDAGEEFTVTVKTTKNDGFYFGNANLEYDSSLVQFVSADTSDSAFEINDKVVVKAVNKTDKEYVVITIGTMQNAMDAMDSAKILNATLMTATDVVVTVQFKAIADLDADAVANFKLFATSAFIQGKPTEKAPTTPNMGYVINGSTDGSKSAEKNVNIVAENHDCKAYADKKIVLENESVAVTCLVDGKEVWQCPHCFEKHTDVIKAPGAHTLVEVEAKAPTCTEKGWAAHVYCSKCDYTTKVEKDPQHTVVVDAAVEATCTEDGKTEGKHCSVCNEVIVAQEKIEATGHTIEKIPGKEATWNETGLTEGEKCTVCGEVLVAQEVIDATGFPVWAIILIVVGSLVIAAGVVLLILFKMGKLGKKA